jgi:hypothetical protein
VTKCTIPHIARHRKVARGGGDSGQSANLSRRSRCRPSECPRFRDLPRARPDEAAQRGPTPRRRTSRTGRPPATRSNCRRLLSSGPAVAELCTRGAGRMAAHGRIGNFRMSGSSASFPSNRSQRGGVVRAGNVGLLQQPRAGTLVKSVCSRLGLRIQRTPAEVMGPSSKGPLCGPFTALPAISGHGPRSGPETVSESLHRCTVVCSGAVPHMIVRGGPCVSDANPCNARKVVILSPKTSAGEAPTYSEAGLAQPVKSVRCKARGPRIQI